MKKIICLLLACLLLVPTFAMAYGGTAPVTPEKKTLTILTTNSASRLLDFENMTWWQMVLDKANIELEIELVDASAYNDAVSPRLAAGRDLPDIVYLPNPDSDMSLANSGLFVDLKDYYENNAVHLKKWFEKIPTLKASLTTTDGGMYYLPMITHAEDDMRTVIINKQYLAKLGMTTEDIVTLDDFTAYLRAVKAGDMNDNGDTTDEIPLFIRSGMINLLRIYFGLEGEGFYQIDDGKVICTAIDDRYKDFLTWANMCYEEGLIYNEFPTAGLDTQNALLATNSMGSILHFAGNSNDYNSVINPEWQANVDEAIMYPLALRSSYTDDQPVVWGRSSYSGFAWAITKFCDDPELAFEFMDYLYSDEVACMTRYGVEGVDFEMVDGKRVFSEEWLADKDNYRTSHGFNCGALPNHTPEDWPLDMTLCTEIADAVTKYMSYRWMPTIGFGYYPEEDNEILSMYQTDLKTYFNEQMLAFILGNRSLDEWDAYVAAAKAMGVDEVVSVYQRSYDSTK